MKTLRSPAKVISIFKSLFVVSDDILINLSRTLRLEDLEKLSLVWDTVTAEQRSSSMLIVLTIWLFRQSSILILFDKDINTFSMRVRVDGPPVSGVGKRSTAALSFTDLAEIWPLRFLKKSLQKYKGFNNVAFGALQLSKILRLNFCSPSRLISFLPSFNSQNGFPGRRRHFSSAVNATEFEFDDIPNDAKAKEKDAALRVGISQLASDFGKESMLSLQRFFGSRQAPVVPTGSLRLDLALGIGGLPKGRIVEIFGQEASGKTTLALHVIKEAQKTGGNCAHLDVENAMNPTLAESMGVDTQNLLIAQPDYAENLLNMVDTWMKSGSIDVIVVDSVAALVPKLEIDSVDAGSTRDIQSKIMTQALRKIHYSLAHSRTLIIFVNQATANLKSGLRYHPSDEVTSGGNALPFYAAIRLKLIRKRLLKTLQDKAIGLAVCAKVIKNKLAPAMKDADLTIKLGRGICCVSEILDLGSEHGSILHEGGSYYIEGEVMNSKEEAEDYLGANAGVMDKVVSNLRCQLFPRES